MKIIKKYDNGVVKVFSYAFYMCCKNFTRIMHSKTSFFCVFNHTHFQEANNEIDTCEVRVQLLDIFDFAAGGSRLVQEGERVFNAAHLLIVGVEQVHEDGVNIFSTCLQSSSPSSEPHVIKIRTKESFSQWSLTCTCKAGKGKCKHQMAVLYHLLK